MKSKRTLSILDFCVLTIVLFFTACNSQQAPNPIERLPDIHTLSERVGFTVTGLSNLPGDTTAAGISLIGGELGEVGYVGRDEQRDYEFVYRMKKGSEKIDGIHTEYSDPRDITVNGTTVSLRAEGDEVYVANWEKDGVSYSLFSNWGIEDDLVASLLEAPLA